MNITESIKALAISYIAKFDVVDDIEGINEGFCGYFAEDIAKQIDGAVAIWDNEKIHSTTKLQSYHHCFILFEERYYDSESPEGVDHPKDLFFYKREVEYLKWVQKRLTIQHKQ